MSVAALLARPSVVELRQYTLHPGRRDELIELFEREFVEPQGALGMRVLGTFRDLDDPNRFVWLRAFADMASRAEALAAFYDGAVWEQHRNAANATMIDSDNVLLLRPSRPDSGGAGLLVARAPIDATASAPGLITATLCPLPLPVSDDLIQLFEQTVRPAWTAAGADFVASFVTETAANNFPRLLVRTGEPTFVWLARFANAAALRRHAAMLAACDLWNRTVWPAWRARLAAEPQTLRLAPTARSALHG